MLSQYILLHRRNVASGWARANRWYNWIVRSALKSGLNPEQAAVTEWSDQTIYWVTDKLTGSLENIVFWSVTIFPDVSE